MSPARVLSESGSGSRLKEQRQALLQRNGPIAGRLCRPATISIKPFHIDLLPSAVSRNSGFAPVSSFASPLIT